MSSLNLVKLVCIVRAIYVIFMTVIIKNHTFCISYVTNLPRMLNEGWIDYMIYFSPSVCLSLCLLQPSLYLLIINSLYFLCRTCHADSEKRCFRDLLQQTRLYVCIYILVSVLCMRWILNWDDMHWDQDVTSAGLYFSRECFDYTIWLPFNLNLLIHMLSKLIFPDGQLIWPHTHCLHCQKHIIVHCFKSNY